MWIDTNVNGERKLYNLHEQDSLEILHFSKDSTAWKLQCGNTFLGTTLGVFSNFENAVSEYENICEAITDGVHYYKIRNEEAADVAGQGT